MAYKYVITAAIIAGGILVYNFRTEVNQELCTLTGTSAAGETVGILYNDKKFKRARADWYTTYKNHRKRDHFIITAGRIYFWHDANDRGITFPLIEDANPKDIFDSSLTKFLCSHWSSPKDIIFIPPDYIEFQQLSIEEEREYLESRNKPESSSPAR